MTILNYFPKGLTPRPQQVAALNFVAENWNKAEVFCLNVPVAGGKSAIAKTIAMWSWAEQEKRTNIITPTNLLVEQYDSPYSLYKQGDYKCSDPDHSTCQKRKQKEEAFCNNCPYVKDKYKAMTSAYSVMNYHTYMSNKMYAPKMPGIEYSRPILVVDEAHNLLEYLKNMGVAKLWQHKFHWPLQASTFGEFRDWVSETLPRIKGQQKEKRVIKLAYELWNKGEPRYILNKTKDYYKGSLENVLRLEPVDVTKEPPYMWPGRKVSKIILMSGTINKVDVESMGLGGRRVKYFECSSPIPADQRPIYFDPVGSLSYKYIDQNLAKLVDKIEQISAERPEQKGIVHATYFLASKLKKSNLGKNSRFLFHDNLTKGKVYKQWRESENRVLIASGMSEGLDLLGDAGRFQIIAKIPWPSLTDPAIKYKLDTDENWYQWQALKTVIQMTGRICRSPEDWGDTYIMDSSFKRIRKEELAPQWFVEALRQ